MTSSAASTRSWSSIRSPAISMPSSCRKRADAGIDLALELAGHRGVRRRRSVRLKQVVSNLIRNAIRHTERGGTIILRSDTPAAGCIRITVRDSGIGIPPGLLERIFVPFEQADRSHGVGLGLGLAIAKGLVEQQGGASPRRVRAGNGATFTVELPTVPPPDDR